MAGVVHVAAGALLDASGRILLAKRHDDAHQGGLWEFPGGKIEPGETPEAALARELHEEIGVWVESAQPLIRVSHRYPELEVVLHVYRVHGWSGEPHSREGQPLAWAEPGALADYPMPAADRPIVAALQLPDRYVITPPEISDPDDFLAQLDALLTRGLRLLQYRVFDTAGVDAAGLFRAVEEGCRGAGVSVLLNAGMRGAELLQPRGLHLNSRQLRSCKRRPEGVALIAASCHDAADLARARQLGLDFAVLSPVLPTRSHPDAQPLRWDGFARLVRDAGLPVYALGGMHERLLPAAQDAGGQGIAGIRGFWDDAKL